MHGLLHHALLEVDGDGDMALGVAELLSDLLEHHGRFSWQK